MKIPERPTFIPTQEEKLSHDKREAKLSLDRAAEVAKEYRLVDSQVVLMEKIGALDDRIAKLESLLPLMTVARLLLAGPNDTVVFHVPDSQDLLDGRWNTMADSLKEKMGVRCVLFAHNSVVPTIVSRSKE